MEAGEGVAELRAAGPGGHAAQAGAAPVDGAVGQEQPRRRLRGRQHLAAGRAQLLRARHHHHVLAALARLPHAPRRHLQRQFGLQYFNTFSFPSPVRPITVCLQPSCHCWLCGIAVSRTIFNLADHLNSCPQFTQYKNTHVC